MGFSLPQISLLGLPNAFKPKAQSCFWVPSIAPPSIQVRPNLFNLDAWFPSNKYSNLLFLFSILRKYCFHFIFNFLKKFHSIVGATPLVTNPLVGISFQNWVGRQLLCLINEARSLPVIFLGRKRRLGGEIKGIKTLGLLLSHLFLFSFIYLHHCSLFQSFTTSFNFLTKNRLFPLLLQGFNTFNHAY